MSQQQEDKKFDGIFMSVIQQKGNIDGFFDTVFGFLRRNTDFFTNQKKAEEIIVGTCKKNFDKYKLEKTKKDQQQKKKKEREEKKRLQQKLKKQKQEAKQKVVTQQPPKQVIKPKIPEKIVEEVPSTEKKQEKDEPAPKGNGGRTQKYIWTQTLEELHMYIPVANTISKKNITIKYTLDSLFIGQKDQQPIINGKFFQKINVDDTYWTIQDGQLDGYKGKYIHLTVDKWKNQTSWWSTPIKGDAEINTQKINPQPSKLDELQGETRSTVQKMMFDMRQKQMGLPSSDQLQKQEKLKDFMKAHPQMDFSKCKFG